MVRGKTSRGRENHIHINAMDDFLVCVLVAKRDCVIAFLMISGIALNLPTLTDLRDGLVPSCSQAPSCSSFSPSSTAREILYLILFSFHSIHPATGTTLTASTSNNVSTTGFPVIPVHCTKISNRSSHSPFAFSTPLSRNGFRVTGPNFWNWSVNAGVSKLAIPPSKSEKKDSRQVWEPSDPSCRA